MNNAVDVGDAPMAARVTVQRDATDSAKAQRAREISSSAKHLLARRVPRNFRAAKIFGAQMRHQARAPAPALALRPAES